MCLTLLETADTTVDETIISSNHANTQYFIIHSAQSTLQTCLSTPHPPFSPPLSELGVICIDCFVQLDTEVIQWDYHTISCLLHLLIGRVGEGRNGG